MQQRIARALARSLVYEYFSVGFLYPEPETFGYLVERQEAVRASLSFLRDRETYEGMNAFQMMVSGWTPSALEEEYCRVFTHTISKECPPYEGEYDSSDIFQKSQVMADIAGFYRAFGLELSPSFKEGPDHISAELEFMHYLAWKEALALQQGHGLDKADLCLDAQKGFLESHLSRWLPLFERRLEGRADGGPYGLLGKIVGAFIRQESRDLGLAPAQVGGMNTAKNSGTDDEGCSRCAEGNLEIGEVELCL